jgi:phosphoribosylamine-glycine ligase
MLDGEELVTAGASGFIAAPLAVGETIREAFDCVKSKIERIKVPNMQYRTDIARKVGERYHTPLTQGWLR